MLSIIISSYRPGYLSQIKQNIEDTVGIPYEIIAVDNSKGTMGLCEVYNKGVVKARYDLLCFAHEDILLKSKNWGRKVIEIFNANQSIGLIGVAGGSYKPFAPSTWSFPGAIRETGYINVIQGSKRSGHLIRKVILNPRNEKLSQVVTIDGLWFCTKKSIALEMPFDEINFRGFHCYDIDFSLSVFQKYMVVVTFEIMIEHFSEGNYDKTWIEEVLKYHQKWDDRLPVNLENISPKLQMAEEKKAFAHFIRKMSDAGYSPYSIFKKLSFYNNRFQMGRTDVALLKITILKEVTKRIIKKLMIRKATASL